MPTLIHAIHFRLCSNLCCSLASRIDALSGVRRSMLCRRISFLCRCESIQRISPAYPCSSTLCRCLALLRQCDSKLLRLPSCRVHASPFPVDSPQVHSVSAPLFAFRIRLGWIQIKAFPVRAESRQRLSCVVACNAHLFLLLAWLLLELRIIAWSSPIWSYPIPSASFPCRRRAFPHPLKSYAHLSKSCSVQSELCHSEAYRC